MEDDERKRLAWTNKKDLLTLSADELLQIIKAVGPVSGIVGILINCCDCNLCHSIQYA